MNRISILVVLILTACAGAHGQTQMVFTQGTSVKVCTPDGVQILELSPRIWGPAWKWVGLRGQFEASDDAAVGTFTGKVTDTAQPLEWTMKVSPVGPRQVKVVVTLSAPEDLAMTAATLAIKPGSPLQGDGRGTVHDPSGARVVNVPMRGALSKQLQRFEMRDAQGNAYRFTFDEPANVWADGEARIDLAGKQIAADVQYQMSMTMELPGDVHVYLSAQDIPSPEGWDRWFEWTGEGDTATPSVIDMSAWLDAPAGRHGRVTRKDDQLIYNGKPTKFWGLNLCYNSISPPREVADRKAAFYAKYGINAVRFHKFADGPGGGSVLTDTSAVAYDPQKLDNMDYLVWQLKKHGIFVKLSANFGRVPVGPDDFARIPYVEEFKKLGRSAWRETPQGAMWYADEVAQLQIEQLTNLLKHTNPHTGMRYADDPAIMVLELVNENTAYFFAQGAMEASPTIKRLAGQAFFAWLQKRYRTEEALLAAWGADSINCWGHEKMTGEGWDKGLIYPVGKPWYFDPERLNGQLKSRKQRLLDTMAFLYDRQNAFYDQFVRAIRETGYTGEILASNWQAGRAYGHYLNLHSDARVGMIDRHNYFGGTHSMLAAPGGGLLSSGMQQVADRPFMLSEWIHVFPSEFSVEGPALVGAYGMGLNGWDVSYMFQNRDVGTFRQQLGETWDVVVPQVIGVFPAVARQVHRGDVRQSSLQFSRNVHVPSLKKGELGFDDQVTYDYDVKQFDSKTIPAATLAIGRSVVTFTDRPTPTVAADLTPYQDGDMIRSSTGELAWRPGKSPRDGYVTINTPGTQAVIGFADGKAVALRDVAITSRSWYAAVYVTALDVDADIATGQRLLITTIARVRNTGMKMVAGSLIARGGPPMLVEPVTVDLTFRRTEAPTIHILDHDGRRTGQTLTPVDGKITLDGAQTHAIYYEVVYDRAPTRPR
jgi:hypothetical protein